MWVSVCDVVVRRGRLDATAPAQGETVERLFAGIEHIVSGEVATPVDYVQDTDEWVVLLDGSARLDVGGEDVRLAPGEWVVLPAGVPHRLVQVTPGSRWLAVHVTPGTSPRPSL